MSVAFKEWAVVCEALGCGAQSLLIRKGGIAEGREGFAFRHKEFLLFPTWFHAQARQVRGADKFPVPPEPTGVLEIRYAAVLEWTKYVEDIRLLKRLKQWHVWSDEVIEERFHYDTSPGAHVALVRTFRLDPPLRVQMKKSFGGCRSWVEVPDPEGIALVSVLSDEAHDRVRAAIESILQP